MSDDDQIRPETQAYEFIKSAEQAKQGFVREIFNFLKSNWLLAPIVILLLLFGALLILSSGVAAPFIYTLF